MSHNVSKQCPDCGENPVNHGTEWFTALSESAIAPVGMIIDVLTARLRSALFSSYYLDKVALPLFRALAALRLGTLTVDVDEFDSGRNRWLWDSAKRRGMTMHEFRVLGRPDGMNFFVAARDGKTIAFEGLPRPDRRVSSALNWMDNKAVLKKKLMAADIPVARGRACATYTQALATLTTIQNSSSTGASVIVKPHIGSRGRHTTIHIDTPEKLRTAFRSAKKLSPWVVVEQELQGRVFRVLLVQGKVEGIVRREEPHVIGDGTLNVRQLVECENLHPARRGPTFHPLLIDEESTEELQRQNITWDTIPPKGAIVSLNTHVSRYYGASTTDFTERAHPDNIALFEHLAATINDSLIGVDFIIDDMERSWKEQLLCGVIECNSLPNIDLHHDVLYGKNRDMAGLLLDMAFGT